MNIEDRTAVRNMVMEVMRGCASSLTLMPTDSLPPNVLPLLESASDLLDSATMLVLADEAGHPVPQAAELLHQAGASLQQAAQECQDAIADHDNGGTDLNGGARHSGPVGRA